MIDNHIKLATLDDIPVLLVFAKNFFQASPYRSMRFDVKKGQEFLKGCIVGSLRDHVCLMSLKDGQPTGFIVGAASEPVFSRAKVGMELGWWVEPEHRRTRGSLLLFEAYEDWCGRVGCSHIQAAYLPGVSPDLDAFYKKRGYQEVESSYLKCIRI